MEAVGDARSHRGRSDSLGNIGDDSDAAVIGVDAAAGGLSRLEPPHVVQVQDVADELGVLLGDGLVVGQGRGVEEVDDTLAGADGQGVGGQGDVLGLLDGLGLEEGPSRIPDRRDGRVVWEPLGLERDVDDDGEVGELVQVGD